MTLTVRSASVTGATTASRALTHAEMDANWAHVIQSSNQSFLPSGMGAITTETVQAALRRLVHTAQYATLANYKTARAALTGTFGMNSLDIDAQAPGGSATVLRIPNSDGGVHGDFSTVVHSGAIDIDMNTSWSWGYNVEQELAGEPAVYYTIESDFNAGGGTRYMEMHIQGSHADASTFRCWSWTVNRSTKAITNVLEADRFSIGYQIASNNEAFHFLNTATTGDFFVNSGSNIKKSTNNVAWLYQSNAGLTNSVELIRADSSDRVSLGGAGGSGATVIVAGGRLQFAVATCELGADGPGVISMRDQTTPTNAQTFRVYGGSAGYWEHGSLTENLTLSTGGTTTDTSASLLPQDSIIHAVTARITTAIATATQWAVGDPTTSARFSAANGTLTLGTTSVGITQCDQTGAPGPKQTSAAKVRITTTGTPSAGRIRLTSYFSRFLAPTS